MFTNTLMKAVLSVPFFFGAIGSASAADCCKPGAECCKDQKCCKAENSCCKQDKKADCCTDKECKA